MCYTSTAIAQEQNNRANEITLQEAIQTALTENLELKTVRETVGIAKAQLARITLLNPELESEILPQEGGEFNLELSKEFQIAGQRGHKKRIAQVNLDKTTLEIKNAERLLIREVKEAFLKFLYLQEQIKLQQTIVNLREQILKIAQIKFEAGEIPITEVNTVKVERQTAEREKMELENELALAQLRLNSLLSKPLESDIRAAGELRYEPLELSFDDLKRYAIENRPDLKSLQLKEQMNQSELDKALAERIPNLGISFITRRELAKASHETFIGGKISIPLPLFDRNRGSIDEAKAKGLKIATEIANKRQSIFREVVSAKTSVSLAKKVIQFYEQDILDLLDENLELMQTAYELGEAELLEVLRTQDEFIENRFAYLKALFNYQVSVADLECAVGGKLKEEPKK